MGFFNKKKASDFPESELLDNVYLQYIHQQVEQRFSQHPQEAKSMFGFTDDQDAEIGMFAWNVLTHYLALSNQMQKLPSHEFMIFAITSQYHILDKTAETIMNRVDAKIMEAGSK